jgi:predicted Zn finger-like uncharacterized protein
MPIQTACPSCKQQLRVPDNLIGELVKCPKCDNAFTAVAESNAPSQPSEPAVQETSSAPEEGSEYKMREPAAPPRPPRSDDDDFLERRPRSKRDYVPHRGTLILVLGILSLTGLGIFTGLPAWIMGSGDMKQIRAGTMDPEGMSNTNIGRILGMISTLIFIVVTVPGCFVCCLIGPLASHR